MLEIDIRKVPVFWINLDADVVRREAMLTFFATHNFENVTRVPGVVHSDHKTGVTLAHLDAFNASPEENFDVNTVGIFTVLNECRKKKIKRFILASTGGALISSASPPVNEESLPRQISPYGGANFAETLTVVLFPAPMTWTLLLCGLRTLLAQ